MLLGTGKSIILGVVLENSIADTIQDIVSKSEKAIVNPRSNNATFSMYDESMPLYDTAEKLLSSQEKSQRRVENAALSKGQIRHDVTIINKETSKRWIEQYKIETDGALAVNTNVILPNEGDPMADRFIHIQITKKDRPGKSINEFQGNHRRAAAPQQRCAVVSHLFF